MIASLRSYKNGCPGNRWLFSFSATNNECHQNGAQMEAVRFTITTASRRFQQKIIINLATRLLNI